MWNLAFWEEFARKHQAKTGSKSSLRHLELAALGSLQGRRVLHLQCHQGAETLELASRCGHITGVDFSPTAISRARALAVEAGSAANFVVADTQNLPEAFNAAYDIAYASYGILEWIPDISAWFRSAARSLCRGGRIVLIDTHPASKTNVKPISGTTGPIRTANGKSDPELQMARHGGALSAAGGRIYFRWQHSIEQIKDAAVAAGFTIEDLIEYPFSHYSIDSSMVADAAGYWVHPNPIETPLLFALHGHKN